MRFTNFTRHFVFSAVLTFILSCCNSKSTEEKGSSGTTTTETTAPQDSLVLTEIEIDTTYQNKAGGSEKAAWKKIFRKSAKSDWMRTADYMGPTNTLYLGTIQDEDGNLASDLTGLDSSQMSSLINIGAEEKTGFVEKIRNDLSAVLASEFKFPDPGLAGLDADLNAAIGNTRQMDLNFTWAVDNLKTTPLKRFLNQNNSNDKWADYYTDLTNPKNKVITKVIRVANFNGTITLDRDLSAGLKAKLAGWQTAQLANGKADISVKSTGNRTITVQSSPKTVYVFAVWSKANKIAGLTSSSDKLISIK